MSFAESTTVPLERSKLELDRMLQKHGATQRGLAHDDDNGFAIVFFSLAGRQIRLQIPLPKVENFRLDHNRRPRTREAMIAKWEQACRTRFRAIVLITKAKLELIEMGLSSVDREFLADITLPDGRSVAEFLKGGLDEAYLSGRMPPMLGMGSRTPAEGEEPFE